LTKGTQIKLFVNKTAPSRDPNNIWSILQSRSIKIMTFLLILQNVKQLNQN